jgi:SAM-dependent methyltransferase
MAEFAHEPGTGEPDPETVFGGPASAAWDAAASTRHREEQSAYLSYAAGMTPVRLAAAQALAMLNLGPGDRVLDIGCGTGVALPDLARAVAPGGRVAGLDHASALLDEASDRADEAGVGSAVHLVTGDAHALPYATGSFSAAYISRVLMHLADPGRALLEARRVVNPGGWVVAIEPDFAGMRIDHVDPEAAHALVAGICAPIRHPAMGIELFRRLDDAGLVTRTVSWVTELESVYDPELTAYYRRAADHAVAAGWLERPRADAAVDYLVEAGAHGRYVSYSSLIIAAGCVPG